MAFIKEASRAPVAIGDLEVILFDPNPLGLEPKRAGFRVRVIFNTGEVKEISGDLVPHLTAQQITALQAFMATLRTQAATQILP